MADSKIKRKVIRLAILGDTTVGKTSIINVYLNLEFSQLMVTSVGKDKYDTQIEMKNGEEMKLIIWDTAGQERFHSIAVGTIKNSHGIIVTFDITRRKTFDNVLLWLKEIRENSGAIPVVLFGNKCDLEEKREVKKEEAQNFAKKNKMIYFETSAKENINIKEGFKKLAELAYEASELISGIELNNKKKKKGKKCC